MKIWEMIKELEENPEKKFRAINSKYPNDKNNIIVSLRNVDVVFEKEYAGILAMIDLSTNYEEVKKPVTFMEAVESGEKLMVEHDLLSGEGTEYFKNFNYLDGFMYKICALFGPDEVRQIIVKGKWYIG